MLTRCISITQSFPKNRILCYAQFRTLCILNSISNFKFQRQSSIPGHPLAAAPVPKRLREISRSTRLLNSAANEVAMFKEHSSFANYQDIRVSHSELGEHTSWDQDSLFHKDMLFASFCDLNYGKLLMCIHLFICRFRREFWVQDSVRNS